MYDPTLVLLTLVLLLCALIFSTVAHVVSFFRFRQVRHLLNQMIARYDTLRDLHRSLVLDYEDLMKDDEA